MKPALFFYSCLLAALLFAPAAAPAAVPAPEQGVKYVKLYRNDVVAADGSEKITTTIAVKVLRQDAVDGMKELPLTYSTSAEKIHILKAYTQKPDGHRISAPKDNFQTSIHGGSEGGAPAFSDQSTLTVVFPDVAVGDTLHIVYERDIVKPLFPKQFSSEFDLSRAVLYDDVRISYSIPRALHARYKSYGLTQTMNKRKNGRQLLAWSFKNAKADNRHYAAAPVYQYGDWPAVIVSTFPSYGAISAAYGARANPKAAVTPQIRALADRITKGKKTLRSRAKALYDWEISNISYAGNCIGIGAVVPRNLGFVLRNKMGDCKDHATLLQALLAAKGIRSTQALIGINPIYKLPPVPVVSIVNHVINYIPALNMYLDATSGMPFGTLPLVLTDKPVLRVDGYKKGARTPRQASDVLRVKVTGNVSIAADGTANGVTTISSTGPAMDSYTSRQRIESLTPQKRRELAERALAESGFQGRVTFAPGTLNAKTMTYTYSIHYHLKNYVQIGTPGALRPVAPFSPQPVAEGIVNVMRALAKKDIRPARHGTLCAAGKFIERYSFHFPKTMSILAVPKNAAAATDVQNYSAKYKLAGRTLTVSRVMTDTSPAPVCPPAVTRAYKKLAAKVWPDLRAQIVYK